MMRNRGEWVLTSSGEQLVVCARRLRNRGCDPSLDWHQHPEIAFSYRLSDINCALGISQWSRIEKIVERRQALVEIMIARSCSYPHPYKPHCHRKNVRFQ